jgi:cytochrome c-type biogenesis protein
VLFGMVYALASLGCAAGPFLAIVAGSLRAGSAGRGLALFVSYAAGMGLIIAVTALAVALVRVSAVARLRRAAAFVPRLGGVVLVVAGGYVAYYGWYELRLVRDLRAAGHDPVINFAGDLQHRLAGLIGALGAGRLLGLLVVLLLLGVAGRWVPRRGPHLPREAGPDAGPEVQPDARPDAGSVVGSVVGPDVRPEVGPSGSALVVVREPGAA